MTASTEEVLWDGDGNGGCHFPANRSCPTGRVVVCKAEDELEGGGGVVGHLPPLLVLMRKVGTEFLVAPVVIGQGVEVLN